MNALLEAALERAQAGAYVLPLWWTDDAGVCACPKGTDCPSPGKHPRTAQGLNDASLDRSTIERWWQRWPDANVGVRTDHEPRIDIDLVDVAQLLASDAYLLAATEVVRTPRLPTGGLHIALVCDDIRTAKLTLADGRKLGDLKGIGGYVLVPPSRIGTRTYTALSAPGVEPMAVDDPIAWLRERLPLCGHTLADAPPVPAFHGMGAVVPAGERHTAVTSYAGKSWVEGMAPAAFAAALQAVNEAICSPPLPRAEVDAIAEHFIERRERRGVHDTRSTPSNERREIVITHRHLRDLAEDGWSGLEDNASQLFQHGGALAEVGREDGRATIIHLSVPRLRGRLDRCADWLRADKVGLVPARPPKDVVEDMLALPRDLPTLRGIIGTPAFAADGTLDLTPGYQPSTGLYYEPSGDPIPQVPASPDATDVRRAKVILQDLLCDFPFPDDASIAHATSIPITGVVREMISGPTPAFVFDAPTPGSGKTLLAGCLGLIVSGTPPAVMTAAKNEEEWRKRITSILRGGSSIALFDNIKYRLSSEAIAGLLTTTLWADRLLSKNVEIRLPNRTLWMLTGNNIELDTDIARRSVAIRLDAMMDRPWNRSQFRHALPEWAIRHRHELVWACLVLGQNWLALGRPPWEGKPLGSYEEWGAIVGGVLQAAGINGFLDNRERLYERMDLEGEEWREFVTIWWREFGEQETRVAALYPTAVEVLPSVFRHAKDDATESSLKAKLGRAISAQRDRRFGDFFIRAGGDDTHAKVNTWRIEVAGDGGSGGPTPAGPPHDNESTPDSFAGDAGDAGVHSGVGQFTHVRPVEGTEKDRVEKRPPQPPQSPQSDSDQGRKPAGDVRGSDVMTSSPPQDYRCSRCRMPMASNRVSDVCGWCKKEAT